MIATGWQAPEKHKKLHVYSFKKEILTLSAYCVPVLDRRAGSTTANETKFLPFSGIYNSCDR